MKKLFVLVALLFTANSLVNPAFAQLKIDITQGHVSPLPIAITDPGATNAGAGDLGRNIMEVVAADLERSGLFRPIDKAAFIEQNISGNAIPRYADWRAISAQGLVTSTVSGDGNNVRIAFRLWDVYGEQQISGKEFNTSRGNWRRIAHLIADEIYGRLSGESGYFDTRIVYVAESGPAKARVKRLAIMDQDGENHKFLTDGSKLVLTPRFSPDSQEILYMSYAGRAPRVHLRDLQTGREEVLGKFDGMSFAPRFNHNGDRIVMSIARDGNSEIYEMDLRSRQMKRLTDNPGIDTSPSYSPDGNKIVFNSDRGGSQQLYLMDASGGGVQRISFGDGRYGTPIWSPRGDLIAFTKMSGGQFFIGVMRTDGSGERTISSSYLEEGPTWAPNGRVIMFTRQGRSSKTRAGISRLYSIDVTGYNLREVVTPMDASDPAWSPLLPK